MARATVLRCDICEIWDSAETHVRNVSVAGPKFDLCTNCRINMLLACRVENDLAQKYQHMVDERVGVRGTMPALSAAIDWEPGQGGILRPPIIESPVDADTDPEGLTAPLEAPVPTVEPVEQPLEDAAPKEDTGEVAPPKRSRTAKS